MLGRHPPVGEFRVCLVEAIAGVTWFSSLLYTFPLMMLRSVLSALALLAVVATASAQTTPVKKTTKTRTAATRSTTAQRQAAPPMAAPAASSGQNASPASSVESADKGQNIYAAPGQPINVQSGPVGPYDGKAASPKTSKGTTLSPR